ncbi:thioesterase family protein [Nocardia sp. 2]|uniref:Thioesterase family protein n=1 Tax=Nocardia acididurans TaxID=2802282 RepID=A0ABS1MBK8_9NOCA|nr:thioesterase family protein [Nocardia acididurans]MBL1078042.1 thioesterase family protein [Nocardia acididurans]
MTSISTHPFDSATGLTALGDGRYAGHTEAGYANMVGPFGGITAATLLSAALHDPRRLADPVALTVNFAGPVADGAFEIDAQPVRTNNATQHWIITMTQNGEVTTTATAVFGRRRDAWGSTEVTPPAVPSAADVPVTRAPGFPAWLNNYEMRFVEGGGDFLDPDAGERPDSTTTLWVRDNPVRPLDYSALAALSDVFFPRVMLRLGRMVPAGTVSLTTYFHADAELLAETTESILGTARAQHFGNGFFDQTASLWTAAGDLLATSHQVVYYKA